MHAPDQPVTAPHAPPGGRAQLDDFARRWAAGERVRVEDYVTRDPALADRPNDLLDLIFQEFVLRDRAGERPSRDEYLARFPPLAGELEVLFEVDGALGGLGEAAATQSGEATDPEGGPPTHPEVSGYEILGLLGRGGMGVVYKARQLRPNRLVALKLVFHHARPSDRARFAVEAEAIAALRHPHIVELYEVGEYRGLPYYTLEFCAGGSLATHFAAGLPRPEDAARMVAQLARAVGHAHAGRIVHRDLTPANVLLTEDGTPKVADFGLAKRLDSDGGATATVSVMGTPGYMSPEQAEGKGRDVGPSADVYGLGGILYWLLAGRPPFVADTTGAVLRQVIEADPEPPSAHRPGVPRDLDTICLKCLRKDPNARYASAADLAADLDRFLAGRPIAARPVSAPERAWRWARRNPGWAALGALLLMAAVGSATTAVLFKRQRDAATDAEGRAQREADDARAARNETQRLLLGSLEADAGEIRAMRLRGQPGVHYVGIPKLLSTLATVRSLGGPQGVTDAVRNELTNALTAADVRVVREWDGWPPDTESVVFDSTLARYARRTLGSEIIIHRAGDGREVCRLPGTATPRDGLMEFSPDGTRLIFCNLQTNQVVCWDVAQDPPRLLWSRTWGNFAAFTPDGREVVLSHNETKPVTPWKRPDSRLLLVEAGTGREVRELGTGRLGPRPCHPTRPWVLVRIPDGKLRVADYRTGEWIGATFSVPAQATFWHPTEPWVALVTGNNEVETYSALTGKPVAPRLSGFGSHGVAVTFSPGGKLAATTEWTGALRLWDVDTGRQTLALPLSGAEWAWRFDPAGIVLGVGRSGSRLRLLEVHRGEGLKILNRLSPVPSVGFSRYQAVAADGTLVAQVDPRRVVFLDPETLAEIGSLPGTPALVGVDHANQRVFTHDYSGLQVWSVRSTAGGRREVGPPAQLLKGISTEGGAVTPDGRAVVLSGYSRGGWVGRVTPGLTLGAKTIGPQDDARSAAVSPDGRWAVLGSHVSGGVYVYDAESGARRARVLEYGGWATFSPGGRWLAVGGFSGGGRLVRAPGWEAVRELPGSGFAFAPDDRLIAVGGDEYALLTLLDCDTGREVVRLEVPEQTRVVPTCFSPDGGRLYAVGGDNSYLYAWDIRQLRARLKGLGADWDYPELRESPAALPPR